MFHRLIGVKNTGVHRQRRVNADHVLSLLLNIVDQQTQPIALLLLRPVLRRVRRFQPGFTRLGPDLNEMHRQRLVNVELGVFDSCSRGSELHFAPMDDLRVAQGVFVFQLAVDDVREDLVLAVRMSAEARRRLDTIFVQHAKTAEAVGEARIVIRGERPSVITVQPAMIRVPTFTRRTKGQLHSGRHCTMEDEQHRQTTRSFIDERRRRRHVRVRMTEQKRKTTSTTRGDCRKNEKKNPSLSLSLSLSICIDSPRTPN